MRRLQSVARLDECAGWVPAHCCVQAAAKWGFESIILWLGRAVISLTCCRIKHPMFGVEWWPGLALWSQVQRQFCPLHLGHVLQMELLPGQDVPAHQAWLVSEVPHVCAAVTSGYN